MPAAVRFEKYGDVDVLQVQEVPRPSAAPGQVVVEVEATSINPGEGKIRSGALAEQWPSTFPSGQGSDLAGIVVEVGAGVEAFEVGDSVLGFSDERSAHAQYVAVPATQLAQKPEDLSWDVAGSLYVAGTTAYAMVRAVGLTDGDTVLISGAAGGVGTIAVQLARHAGATVIGVAGPANQDHLRELGAVPVVYGDGLAERVREAVGGAGVDAVLDTHGDGYVELGLELGVAPERIDTIVDFGAPAKYGVQAVGTAAAATIDVVAELADLAVRGIVRVPIAATYPLSQVREAYTELEHGHTRGKIVLHPRES
jgi:NADPH:quinone reductase-like Zn-dependent oxidoreductase